MGNNRLNKLKFAFLLVLIIGLAVWLASIELEGQIKDFVLKYGYVGFLMISFIGGLNLFVPLPHLVFIPLFLNTGLDPWLLGFLSAFGTTTADAVGYWLGLLGNQSFPAKVEKFKQWTERISRRWPALTPMVLFLWASFVPLPNEALVVPLGIANYGLVKTILITFAGNLIFNLIIIQGGNVILTM
jgi:membrane protein YqaA with SNARE-associated domain